ncbi:hypothetical protein B0H14DRAFT_2591415 [Mycena olivaceomarginata]|nr:hypothetical protein B0H14DRAFT_2591415 [Mycena olivaceomarginata]
MASQRSWWLVFGCQRWQQRPSDRSAKISAVFGRFGSHWVPENEPPTALGGRIPFIPVPLACPNGSLTEIGDPTPGDGQCNSSYLFIPCVPASDPGFIGYSPRLMEPSQTSYARHKTPVTIYALSYKKVIRLRYWTGDPGDSVDEVVQPGYGVDLNSSQPPLDELADNPPQQAGGFV